jgi:hypothetical protein
MSSAAQHLAGDVSVDEMDEAMNYLPANAVQLEEKLGTNKAQAFLAWASRMKRIKWDTDLGVYVATDRRKWKA